LAVAPTRGAVEELQKVGFRDAMTISRLLDDPKAQAALHGRVLVVDEAGMVSGRQMEGLLKLAEREEARILFSGDTRQLQSVEAGIADEECVIDGCAAADASSISGCHTDVAAFAGARV
jgi:ATP-dependent exoDNAse (exonuclease V) alpha subunit